MPRHGAVVVAIAVVAVVGVGIDDAGVGKWEVCFK